MTREQLRQRISRGSERGLLTLTVLLLLLELLHLHLRVLTLQSLLLGLLLILEVVRKS
ncbi:hypothetical protein [Paraburkholderia phenoliruptrix]|uniref:hypothetical protein n=1 Tax=Paraburkholderia phenoliruptrix TaxID=252970 RepID=UPI001583FCA6|nr:hypothetical protein [Paraburkholderia phenoliruptrix]